MAPRKPDFNYDFHVTLDRAVALVEYNCKGIAELARSGTAGRVTCSESALSCAPATVSSHVLELGAELRQFAGHDPFACSSHVHSRSTL